MPECASGCSFKSKQFCDREFLIGGVHAITITQHWHRNCLGLPGGAVWEGAVFMSEYIVKNYTKKMKGAKVLELGCGPALVGILCAKLGASVVTTDYDDKVLELASKNVLQNNVQDTVRVENLPWGERCKETFDFIIGSEVTYSGATWEALATTIVSASKSVCHVILSEGPRYLEDGEPEPGAEGFFKFLDEKSSKEFPFKLIRPEGKEPVPRDVTQEAMDRWAADGIVIWEMVRQKSKFHLPQLLRRTSKIFS